MSQDEDAFGELLSPKNNIKAPPDLAAWKAAQKKIEVTDTKKVIADVNTHIASVMKTIEKVELDKQDSKPLHSFRRITHKEDDPVVAFKN